MWATLINNCTYSWLLITRTLANLNQNRFPLDFLHTFTVILPTVTWSLDNSNLLLTRSNFCFPSDHFYAVLPSLTWTIFLSMWQVKTELSSKTLNLFQNNHVFLVFTFLWVQYKCTMFSTVLWSVHDTCIPHQSHSPTSGLLLRTLDNLNFFQFPLKVRVIASWL